MNLRVKSIGIALACVAIVGLAGECYLRCNGYESAYGGPYSQTVFAERMQHKRASFSENAPKRSKRALVLGCSFAYGLGVEPEETFVWALNELIPECMFENGGISGGSPYMALASLYECYREAKYDLVLFATIGNHLRRDVYVTRDILSQKVPCTVDMFSGTYPTYIAGETRSVRYSYEPLDLWLDRWFALPDFIKNSYTISANEEDIADDNMEGTPGTYRYLLRSMATYAKENGSKFGVVGLYGFDSRAKGRQYVPLELSDYTCCTLPGEKEIYNILTLDASYPRDILADVTTHTMPQEADPELGILEDAGDHPSAIVHRYYAEKIALWIEMANLL